MNAIIQHFINTYRVFPFRLCDFFYSKADKFRSPDVHYNDVIMGAMASQITSLTIVCSTVYSCANQRKHQSSASLAFVRGIHRWPVNSPHKGPATRKIFPFDDVIMPRIRTWTSQEPSGFSPSLCQQMSQQLQSINMNKTDHLLCYRFFLLLWLIMTSETISLVRGQYWIWPMRSHDI